MRWRTTAAAALVAAACLVLALDAAPAAVAVPGTESGRPVGTFAPVWISRPVADASGRVEAAPAQPPVPVIDSADVPVPDARVSFSQPTADARVVVKPKPKPKPAPKPKAAATTSSRPATHHSLRGKASWYCRAGVSPCMAKHPDRAGVADMYAAAGPALRKAICGSSTSNCWRGRRVLVNGVAVVLADWCQCYKGQSNEKVIDLYWDAWTRVPNVKSGVTIRW